MLGCITVSYNRRIYSVNHYRKQEDFARHIWEIIHEKEGTDPRTLGPQDSSLSYTILYTCNVGVNLFFHRMNLLQGINIPLSYNSH